MSFLTNITSVTTNGDVLEDVESIAKPFDFVAALSNLANGSNAGPDPTQETSLLQPTAYTLVNDRGYLKLDGLAGSYASVPDEAALSVLGDLEIIVNFEVQEPGTFQTLVGKYSGSFREYLVYLSANGSLLFARGEGNSIVQYVSFNTVHAVLKPWLKVTHRISDQRCQLYLSDDGITWTQFGADLTMAAVTPSAGTQDVEIGSFGSGSSYNATGSIYRTIIKDGIDGTTVLDIDFTKEIDAHGASTITAETGQEVTLNGGALLIRDAFIDFDKTASDHFGWVAPTFSDGVLIIATKNGTYSGTIDMSGAAELSAMGFTGSHDDVDEEFVGAFVGPSTITAAQKAKVIAEFVKQGAVESFAGVTSLAWRFYQSKFKTLNLKGADNITRMNGCFRTSKLAEVPVLAINNVYTFYQAFSYCPIIDFPAGFFDDWSPASVSSQCFDQTWDECTSLSATSVENILNSINASEVWGTSNGAASGGSDLVDNEIDIDYDVSTGEPDVYDAIDSLASKKWRVVLNGVLQFSLNAVDPYFYATAEESMLSPLQSANLDLDPTNPAGDISLITATNSNGTYINADGDVTAATANTVRIDNSLGYPAMLIEPSATNLLPYSEDYTVSNWVKESAGTGATPIVTSNYASSPDGTQNASRVQFDKGSGTGFTHMSILKYSLTVSSGMTTSKSVYLKSNTTESFDMILYGSSDASGTNGKKITVTPDWQRFDVYGTIPSATTGISIGLREIFVTGLSNTADVLVWGAQLEAGSVATSYIPTSGSWATRTADVYKIDGTNFSDLWNATEGTIYTEFVSRSGFDGTQRYVLGSQSSNARFCYLQGATDDVTTYDGVNILRIPYVPGEINRYAVTFEDSVAVDAMRASLDGTAEQVDPHNGNLLSLPTQLNIGSTQSGAGQLNGHIKRIIYWPYQSDNI